MSSILENKDVRSAIIAMVSAALTWATDAVAAWSGTSLGAFAPAVMAGWAVAVNAIQTRVRQAIQDAAGDATADELQRSIEDRRTETAADYVERVEPRSIANIQEAPPSRPQTLSELADDSLRPTHEWLAQQLGRPVASENSPDYFIFGNNVHWWPLREFCTDSLGALLETRRDVLAASTKRLVLMLAAVLSLAACASASDAMIVGPSAVPAPGYPCALFVQGSLPEGTTIGWDISPRKDQVNLIDPAKDGRSAKLHTMAGRWRVSVAVHEPDRPIYFRFFDVTVPGEPYVPPDGPSPQPITPQPVVPVGPTPIPMPVNPVQPVTPQPVQPVGPPAAGEFGIAISVYDAARAASSPTRPQDCQRLATECRRIATMQVTGPKQMDAVAAEMVRVLLTLPEGWETLKTKVKTTVATLAIGGTIKSAADLQRLLLELADAFERASR